MTWSAYRFSPRFRSRAAFSASLPRLLDLRVDFGQLDLGEPLALLDHVAFLHVDAAHDAAHLERQAHLVLRDHEPLVSIGGTAGPLLACWMRTGVGCVGRPARRLLAAAARRIAMTSSDAARFVKFVMTSSISQVAVERQCARGGGVVELGLAREHFETRDVEIELGAGEARARVDEFDLADRRLRRACGWRCGRRRARPRRARRRWRANRRWCSAGRATAALRAAPAA